MLKLNLIEILLLGIASGVISLTVTKAVIFKSTRDWLESKSEFFGDLVTCPYCFGHWSAAFLFTWYYLSIVTVIGFLPFLVYWLVITFISSICTGIMLKILN